MSLQAGIPTIGNITPFLNHLIATIIKKVLYVAILMMPGKTIRLEDMREGMYRNQMVVYGDHSRQPRLQPGVRRKKRPVVAIPLRIRPFRKIDYTHGAHVVKTYEGDNIKVLILEDTHTMDFKCRAKSLAVHQFVIQQIDSTDKLVDLYLEVPYISKNQKVQTIGASYMSAMQMSLYDCFRSDTKQHCSKDNLRAHYVDKRSSLPPTLHSLLSVLREVHYGYDVSRKRVRALDQKELERIFTDNTSFIMTLANIFDGDLELQKQMDNLDDDIDQAIYNWVHGMITKPLDIDYNALLWPKVKKVLDNIDRGMYVKSDFEPVYKHFVASTSILMDAYAAARMFRNYSTAPSATNIIYFAGGYHTRRLEELLKQLGFAMSFSKNGLHGCVNIKKLHQPVF
jgi:hypothetical protein